MIFKLNSDYPEPKLITDAVNWLKQGKIGIIPTETVYGLCADSRNESAVKKIFAIKNREKNKPLAIAISEIDEIQKWVKKISEDARGLIYEFWPGPLTLVFLASSNVNSYLTNENNTIGIRMPCHEVPLAIIKELKNPLVLTSANKSGGTSPIKINDVTLDQIDFTIDADETDLRMESTVIDVSGETPKLLREGAISVSRLYETIGDILT